ncbi:hypothetical protein G4Y79_23440 [Phototrophicus methaneseepsis]|uniref:STAS/SEC14 domain-containing protein n=1 Tax=Phototrophicus methaneseepsis TaxID=2710758 RepID=A0A7S8IEH5_9CHLR|nr:hypothetical protein [Phototrophicus methaneseepsis]QPC82606.1 hypothetical protein G4Y79_23440 [Phototrophicus methaneseepsis]
MPIHGAWLDVENRIYTFVVVAPWSLEDIISALEGTEHETMRPNAIVYNVTQGKTIPRSFLSIIRVLQQHKGNDVGIRALVGANHVWRMLYKVVDRAFPALTEGFIFADTVEEALDYIHSQNKLSTEADPNLTNH